ncbi:MAG: hypothetical protein AAF823_00145 [Planctomycetota bacterium]
MTQPSPLDDLTPESALRNARLIWAGLTVGVIVPVVVLTVVSLQSTREPTGMDWFFSGIPAAMLPVAALIGYILRQQTHKANWNDDAVTPGGYVTGLVLQLAPIEGVTVIAAVFMVIGAPVAFNLPIIGVALGLMAINFPNGRAMLPPDDRDRIGNFDA